MNMKKYVFLLLCLVLSTFLLISCGNSEETDEIPTDGKTITLKVYNWGEYISDGSLDSYDTNAEFEKYYEGYYFEKYGVRIHAKVVYTTYATNEDMYSKITSGAGSYDILVPSDYMIQKLAEEGYLEEIYPETSIPNYEYIEDTFRNLYFDPDGKYAVPYTYGKVGIIYNETMIDEEDSTLESWGLLWNEKYRGKLLQFNNPRDAFGAAMYYKNIDVNSKNPADWQAALDLLKEQKSLIQAYVSDEIFNKMTGGSAAAAPYYAGDYITMAQDNDALRFYYPKEGTNVFVDAMCMPKDDKRPAEVREMALAYMNFMLSEEAAVANALYIGYASPNALVKETEKYIDEMGEDAIEILYSDVDVNENYDYDPYFHSFDRETQDLVNGLWESLKTENAIEPWVHVMAAVPVVLFLGFGIYTMVIRRKRSAHYRKKKS